MADRYWSYDLNDGIQWHDTAEGAEDAAAEMLTLYADEAMADGEWSDDVTTICWGKVCGQVVETVEREWPCCGEDEEHEDYVDYHLAPMEPSGTAAALRDVAGERERQDAKFGADRDFPDANSDLRRFIAPSEVARKACDVAFTVGRGTWAHILVEEVAEAIDAAGDDAALRAELVQVAAVAAAWIEAIDRREVARG